MPFYYVFHPKVFPMYAAQAVPDVTVFSPFLISVISVFCREADDRSSLFWDVTQRTVALPQYAVQFLIRAQIFTFSISFWCRIHLWFGLMGGLQAKSMTSQRYRAVTRWRMCYYGNVMTTRWWLCVTILHLQQYSHRLNLFLFDIATAGCRTKAFGARNQFTEASLTWRV